MQKEGLNVMGGACRIWREDGDHLRPSEKVLWVTAVEAF